MDEDKIIGRPYIYEAPSDNTFVVSPANLIIPKEVLLRIIQEQDRLKKLKLFEDNLWILQVFAAHPNARITDDLDEYGKPQIVYTDNYGIVQRVSENSLTPSDTTVVPTFSSYDPNSPEAKRRAMYERELKRTDPEKWLLYYGTLEQIDNYLGNKAHFDVLANSAELASLLYGAASSTGRQLFREGARRLGLTGLGQTAKVVFNPYTIPGAVTTSAFTAPYLNDALTNGLNVENSIGIGLGALPYAAPVVTKAYNVGKTAAGSLKLTIDNARNYANYLGRVAAYNNRGRLNIGVPVPDITVNEHTARAALKNVKASLANKTAIDPNDIRILDTKAGQSVLSKGGNSRIRSLVYKNAKSPEVELLNKVHAGADLDPNDITTIVENDQLLSTLSSNTANALREAYDDILYQSLANAENRAEAANNILSKLRTPKYRQQILDEITLPKPAVTPEPTPTPETADAAESVTIEATPLPAAPARQKTLAERWMEIYPGMHDMKFGRPGKKFGNLSGYYNTISDANGNIVPNKIGFEGNTFTLTELGGKPMISGLINPGDIAEDLLEYIYNPKWYSVADLGADPNLGKVRKWFRKPAENLNAKVRTNFGDITVTGPGVDRTKLSNWLLGIAGLGAVGYGTPVVWGGIKSLFGGSGSDLPQRVIFDADSIPYPVDATVISPDSSAAIINGELMPIHPIGDGNFRVIPIKDAMEIDTYNTEKKAANQNSGPKTINEEESDTIFAE